VDQDIADHHELAGLTQRVPPQIDAFRPSAG
jgi:hypothetical protein